MHMSVLTCDVCMHVPVILDDVPDDAMCDGLPVLLMCWHCGLQERVARTRGGRMMRSADYDAQLLKPKRC